MRPLLYAVRGVGYAVRAASISNFDVAEVAASYALAAAGLVSWHALYCEWSALNHSALLLTLAPVSHPLSTHSTACL